MPDPTMTFDILQTMGTTNFTFPVEKLKYASTMITDLCLIKPDNGKKLEMLQQPIFLEQIGSIYQLVLPSQSQTKKIMLNGPFHTFLKKRLPQLHAHS